VKTQPCCPLCADPAPRRYHRDRRRAYLQCPECALVFVPPEFHLDPGAEKAEYDLHRNEVDDPGYRRFLARLAEPLLARLPEGSNGLDFGCGPGPALAALLTEAGCTVRLYDIFYYPDENALAGPYQFVTATEVVEHLQAVGSELDRLWAALEPAGYLGVMTKLVRNPEAFASWHYKNDPTHVCFFSDQTWRWWARRKGAELQRFGADVALLRKP
jgi:2-polyprenyl-3-methyl-5-hydroxy-6-metoxy-1,4-benzoquinol methylase